MPSIGDLQKFIEVFDRIARFEVEQRFIRNASAFSAEEVAMMPFPEVQRVMEWLRQLADEKEKGPPTGDPQS